MTTVTHITSKSVTYFNEASRFRDDANIEAMETRHDDIYPANPENPFGWPKWRRVVTNMRYGFAVIYTHHEV